MAGHSLAPFVIFIIPKLFIEIACFSVKYLIEYKCILCVFLFREDL